ncbi:DUF4065 domain-containing protein [Alphaproteobacteria bacterium]|nr:DUF4065 domain-containing protein [Alphaproteobacteria bacterium]
MQNKLNFSPTTLDIACWLIERNTSAGFKTSSLKLQFLLYIAQGQYLVENNGNKLMPANFILTQFGPIEPNIYQIYKDNMFKFKGNKLSSNFDQFISLFWQKNINNDEEGLLRIIKDNNGWKEIVLLNIFSEIPLNLIYKTFANTKQMENFNKINLSNSEDINYSDKEYWTMDGKKGKRWIPGLSKKSED